jgi:hypothetical protein
VAVAKRCGNFSSAPAHRQGAAFAKANDLLQHEQTVMHLRGQNIDLHDSRFDESQQLDFDKVDNSQHKRPAEVG